MAGHSKWNNIKRRKEAQDAQKGKIFTKFGREIQVAVKEGGADPESNAALKDAIARAKANNMPNSNIERSIQKALGSGGEDQLEDIIYEGYGPSGVAVMVRCLTDNRNRTAGEVRHIFDKYGGNLGTSGCVAFQFERKGSLIMEREKFPEEEEVMMAALEAGAEDFITSDEGYEIITSADAYPGFRDAMIADGYEFLDMSLGPLANTGVEVSDPEQVEQLEKLLSHLEDCDDVQDVYHNWDD
ncbi:MAG: YebC/PmpR family DNA-binding transcriptional regulator [Eubacteriales bacterium]|nr:YebC/PmpR family DNA-binding transcriptional regulator [Eubacteriales bacterium]